LSVNEYPIKPVAFRGRYYKRKGASNHQLSADEIVEMRMMSLNMSFDSFMAGTSVDDLQTDTYQANHRNKLLAEAFYLMDEVEKYGTGFIRIRQYLQQYPDLQYTIQDNPAFFRIFLQHKDVPKDVPKEKRLELLIALIKRNNKMTQPALAQYFNVDLKTIKRDMEQLKKEGKVLRRGGKKDGYWQVLD
jgi:ATP-dependent DNA helicase RecG